MAIYHFSAVSLQLKIFKDLPSWPSLSPPLKPKEGVSALIYFKRGPGDDVTDTELSELREDRIKATGMQKGLDPQLYLESAVQLNSIFPSLY